MMVPILVVSAETEMLVTFETSKVATPVGTVFGVQLAAVFQSLLIGFRFHVAFWAKTEQQIRSKSRTMRRTNFFMPLLYCGLAAEVKPNRRTRECRIAGWALVLASFSLAVLL